MSSTYDTGAPESGLSLPVAEMFYSIQGEGYNTGKPAYFIRLGGCDVRCPWCDSKSTWNQKLYPYISVEDIIREISVTPAVNVVITGGEPLLHPLGHLCDALKAKGYSIFLETSGVHPLTGKFDWICVSPKKHRPPLAQVLSAADEVKVVVGSEADLVWAEKNRKGVNERCALFLQPEWDRRDLAMPLTAEYVKKYPRWRISLQTHKYMNIP